MFSWPLAGMGLTLTCSSLDMVVVGWKVETGCLVHFVLVVEYDELLSSDRYL